MLEFETKVAVITGAGSGIGLSLTRQAAKEGMKLALADVDATALESTASEMQALGAETLTAIVDVANAEAVDTFAAATLDRFGAAHLLFNNAGIGSGGPLWEAPQSEWNLVLGVNLHGVINGIRAFTPTMIEQGEGHIINTASIAGLTSAAGTGTYTVSKHAVVALSEVLHGDLKNAGARVGVSVLCPSFVNTQIFDAARYRPTESGKTEEQIAEEKAFADMTAAFFKTAMAPDAVAEQVFQAIRDQQFYILTHPEGSRELIKERMQAILDNQDPPLVGPEKYPAA